MKLWVMSDLHFEFMPDEGEGFLDALPDIPHDVAVIAGDLCDYPRIPTALRLVGQRFKRVAYVLGNHECYGGSVQEALDRARSCAPSNVEVLECAALGGARLYGATLWFPQDPEKYSRWEEGMSDFFQIRGLRQAAGVANSAAVSFLEGAVAPGEGSTVVTHHLPVLESVHSKFRGSPLNRYFVGEAGAVFERRPRLWVHGHTHESCDYMRGDTRVVCNPHGYWGHAVNPSFDPALVIDA